MDDVELAEGNPRLRWLLGSLAVAVLALGVVWWPGCRHYPAVSSKESLQVMKLLYTACNTRDHAKLTRVEQSLEKAAKAGKLTPQEQAAFRGIVDMARQGEWERAEKASFRFAQDQVGRGHPSDEKCCSHDHEVKKPKPKTR